MHVAPIVVCAVATKNAAIQDKKDKDFLIYIPPSNIFYIIHQISINFNTFYENILLGYFY
jgi:hypothetical protein